MANQFICIHGHFYQPPRENPWLGVIEPQASAYPYHNWNQRITDECYARNAASRILDADQRIKHIVNNYSQISFNFGPTLLSWLEKFSNHTYQSILDADRLSQKRFSSHGSALAQVYNHMIMPLANKKDKMTQVVWGLRDFEHRFKRKAEGMWLAELAVDEETLECLACEGICFTILSPRSAKSIKMIDQDTAWKSVDEESLDITMPYLCRLSSGREIVIFFYDGKRSLEVAFKGLLNNGEYFSERLLDGFDSTYKKPQLIHIATDGESYGHHHKFGDMALAYCLYHIEKESLARIVNYGQFLELCPPSYEVKIVNNTSWSCEHGVGRWERDCGCHTGAQVGWDQKWRKPLRESLNWLRDQLGGIYEKEMSVYVSDVWKARDEYIEVILDATDKRKKKFLKAINDKQKIKNDEKKIWSLLEIQLNAQLMFTSCGWFFDDLAGLEATQVLKYAARAIELALDVSRVDLELAFVNRLKKAKCNEADIESAAQVYVEEILHQNLCYLLGQKDLNFLRIRNILEIMSGWNVDRDKENLQFIASHRISDMVNNFFKKDDSLDRLLAIESMIEQLNTIDIQLDLWETQNLFFRMGKERYDQKTKSHRGTAESEKWIKAYQRLAKLLSIKISGEHKVELIKG